ncbi:hypothetical protein BD410DRAFT_805958 [Rickenella mellea]|uniref:Uncharacterized protein n=1 Tax=Rickenella mellea TaxID=50990 RepID=A0A4Y7PXB7_9AGAM|nr:hypothetical protein BD410DRAFT_805958 [Rickenella mellea]
MSSHLGQPLGDQNPKGGKLDLYAGIDSSATDDRHFIFGKPKAFKHETETETETGLICTCASFDEQIGISRDKLPKRTFTTNVIGSFEVHDMPEIIKVLSSHRTLGPDYRTYTKDLKAHHQYFLCMYLSHNQLLKLHEGRQVTWNLAGLKDFINKLVAHEEHLLHKFSEPGLIRELSIKSYLQKFINELENMGSHSNLEKK